eukprot:TRINITY_DN9760_c0_g1_i2.p1 TRINITY_DN9760_c0_g1~~TRINITY_DN9760_c0_g1_i2.p1  ORF type:complete len:155 (-),score=21.06 TRINITY_DN9760_c0_g1_i2:610-1074(-)
MMQVRLQRIQFLNKPTRGKAVNVVACKPGDLSPDQMQKGLNTQVKRSSSKPTKVKRVVKRGTQKQVEPIQPKASSEESKAVQKDVQGRAEMMEGDKETAAIERQIQNKGVQQENSNGTVVDESTESTKQEEKVTSNAGTELPDGTIVFTEKDLQ